jgi:hypothetical protein
MKTIPVYLVLTLGFLVVATDAQAFDKSGRTAMQFVKIGVGARQTAMGEASISIVQDVNAVFWNPAGISGIQSGEASFSYSRWFAEMNHFSAAVAYTLEDIGTIGLSAVELDYGDIPEALSKASSGSADTRTGTTFTGNDLMFGVTFSHQFLDRLSIGISAKYLQEQLWIYSKGVMAFDFGTCFDTQFRGIRFAMSFQNFGGTVKFLDVGLKQEGYDLPLIFRLGMSIDLVSGGDAFISGGNDHRLSLAVDALNTNDFGDRYNIGAEYCFKGFGDLTLFARTGYRFNYEEGRLSLGAGLEQKLSGMAIRVDYSYVSYEFLESPSRLTLTMAF